MAQFLAGYVEFYNALYERSIFMALSENIENILTQLCEWKGSCQLDISQGELAAIVGVTKEAIGVHLNELKSQGLVEIGYRKIEVKNSYQRKTKRTAKKSKKAMNLTKNRLIFKTPY